MEVLQLVAAGLSNQEIAGRLVITPGTVKKHLEHVYSKLDVHSRTSARESFYNRRRDRSYMR